MNSLYLVFVAQYILVLLCYFLDYNTAIVFARKDYGSFRQNETNKALVWHYEQFTLTKNKAFLTQFHITTLVSIVSASFLFGIVGMKFNLSFIEGMILYGACQMIFNIIGIFFNLYALFFKTLKGGKENEIK